MLNIIKRGDFILDSSVLTDRLIEVLREYYFMKTPLQLERFLQGEMRVLSYICYEFSEHRETIPGEISSSLEMTGGRIAGILRSLEKKGYIIRRTDENDRRKAIIIPTASGISHIEKCTRYLHDSLFNIIGAMGNDSAEAFIKSMNEFVEACRITADSDINKGVLVETGTRAKPRQ